MKSSMRLFVPIKQQGGKIKTLSPIFGEVVLSFGNYSDNDRLQIYIRDVTDEQLLYVPSVNLPDKECPDGHTWIKTWSGNSNIDEMLIKAGIIGPAIKHGKAGYADANLHKILVEDMEEWNLEVEGFLEKPKRVNCSNQ